MASIAESFLGLKSNLEPTVTLESIIEQRHKAVRSAMENIFPSAETKLIGSQQRYTRIHPRPGDKFDIDVLLILGEFDHWTATGGVTVDQALGTRDQILAASRRYGNMDQVRDEPAVTIEFADEINVEIVVAYRDNVGFSPQRVATPKGRGYWVAKPEGWKYADYDHDAKQISLYNAVMDGHLVPTIKMLKALRRDYFADFIGSYHLEILAVQILPAIYLHRQQQGFSVEYPHLIREFFANVGPWLAQPVRLPQSHSPEQKIQLLHTPSLSAQIRDIKDHCDRSLRQLSETDEVHSWKRLFGDLLPIR